MHIPSPLLVLLGSLALISAFPTPTISLRFPAALRPRVEACSCADAISAYNVCLLEICGHDCFDADDVTCVASVEAECTNDVSTCDGFPAAPTATPTV